MSVIENFATLSAQEQQKFAIALVKTINSEKLFHSEVEFKITKVGAQDISGDLYIDVDTTDSIEVPREASWQAKDEESAGDDPGDYVQYAAGIYEDAKKAFKTITTTIDGYTVRIDVEDVIEEATTDIEVEKTREEDSGIGPYDYAGHQGYDSHPYVEVEGIITKECTCALTFWVSPAESDNESENDAELPTNIEVPKTDLPGWDEADDLDREEMLSEYLSDTFGFLHDGYLYEEIGDVIRIDDIVWVVD